MVNSCQTWTTSGYSPLNTSYWIKILHLIGQQNYVAIESVCRKSTMLSLNEAVRWQALVNNSHSLSTRTIRHWILYTITFHFLFWLLSIYFGYFIILLVLIRFTLELFRCHKNYLFQILKLLIYHCKLATFFCFFVKFYNFLSIRFQFFHFLLLYFVNFIFYYFFPISKFSSP